MVAFALAAILIVLLVAIPFVLRRRAAVLSGDREPASRVELALTISLVAINTVPFAPIWPGSSGGDGFVEDWLMVFSVLSLPFWLLVLAIWRACRKWPPGKRCVAAELPALVLQIVVWTAGYPQAVAGFVVIRLADGLVLYKLTRVTQAELAVADATAA